MENKFLIARNAFRQLFNQGIKPIDGRQPVPEDLAQSMVQELIDNNIPKDAKIGVIDAFLILSCTLKEHGYNNLVLLENTHRDLTPSQDKYYEKVKVISGNNDIEYYTPPRNNYNRCNMKFDVIIGNPPYQETSGNQRKDQASNLWSKFWVTALRLAKDDGYVSLITPTSWLSPSAGLKGENKFNGMNRLWDVFNSFTSVADIDNVSSHFKGIGSTFGIVSVDKSGTLGLSFTGGYNTSLGFLPKDITSIEKVSNSICGKVTLGSKFKIDQDSKQLLRVSTPLTRKVSEDNVEILQPEDNPTTGSIDIRNYLYVYVSSQEEALNVKNTIISNSDILNIHCRWVGFMNIKIFNSLNYNYGDII